MIKRFGREYFTRTHDIISQNDISLALFIIIAAREAIYLFQHITERHFDYGSGDYFLYTCMLASAPGVHSPLSPTMRLCCFQDAADDCRGLFDAFMAYSKIIDATMPAG